MKKFLTISVIALFSVSFTACSSNQSNSAKNTHSISINNSNSKVYKIGETGTIDKINFTLKSVDFTSNQQTSQSLRVIYHVKNNSTKTLKTSDLLTIFG